MDREPAERSCCARCSTRRGRCGSRTRRRSAWSRSRRERRGWCPRRVEAQQLRRGDVAVIRGPDPYVLADDPGTEPQVIILPGQQCVTPDGREVPLMSYMGVRTWGNSPVGSTVMLNGTYELEGEVSRRLLGALPPLLVLPGDAWESPLVGLLAEEIVKDEPGQEAVLDRLLDLLLIAVLRAWFARAGRGSAGLVPRLQRSRRRQGAPADPQRPRPPMDGRRAGGRGRRLACGARPPLHRAASVSRR